jgi:hypothetical protein
MAYTKAEIRGLVKTEVLTYLPTIRLDPRTIDFNVRRAEMDVFRLVSQLPAYENVFFQTLSVTDGTQLPARFDFISNVATNDANGNPATYLDIQETGFRSKNQYDLATAESPSYGFCDQKFFVRPNTETLTMGYYEHPLDLTGQSDSTESTIPDELSGLVTLGASKYCMQMLVRFAEQYKLSESDKKNAQAAIQIFGAQYQEQQQLNTRLL